MFGCPIKQRQLSLHENCLPSTREAAEITLEIDKKNQELDHLEAMLEHKAAANRGSLETLAKIQRVRKEIKDLENKFNDLSF